MNKIKLIAPLLAAALLGAAACKEEPKKNKDLIDPATMVHNPRTINGIPPEEAAGMPVLSFTDTFYNFGTVYSGEAVFHEFTFTNTGKSPLLIQGAEGSCGCTVADYPRAPLAPGKSAVMKVVFNSSGKHGHQEKDVAITANTARGVQHLYIQAEVVEPSGK